MVRFTTGDVAYISSFSRDGIVFVDK